MFIILKRVIITVFRKDAKEVFSDLVLTEPGNPIHIIFKIISITTGYIPIAYWFTIDGFHFHLYLMAAIVLIPSGINLDRAFAKFLPRDRSPFPKRWKLEFVGPRILASSVIALLLIIESYGLLIFVFSEMPDVFHIPKTQVAEHAILQGTIYTIIGIPALISYWMFLLKAKEKSRRALFTKKYRP